MSEFKIELNQMGVKNLNKKSIKFRNKLVKAMRGAILDTAHKDIETVAKQKLTTDRHIDTGRLRASIHVSHKETENLHSNNSTIYVYEDREGKTFKSDIYKKNKMFNVMVGTDVSYAKKIERLDSYLRFAFKTAKPKLKTRLKKAGKKVVRGV